MVDGAGKGRELRRIGSKLGDMRNGRKSTEKRAKRMDEAEFMISVDQREKMIRDRL